MNKRKGITIKCNYCHKVDTYLLPCRIDRINYACCSKRCAVLLRRPKTGIYVLCNYCKVNQVYVTPSKTNISGKYYCSKTCANRASAPLTSIRNKGKKIPESVKEKLRQYTGSRTSGWKGGKPKCLDCGKEIEYTYTYCNKCKAKHWTKEHRKKIARATSITLSGRMPINMTRPGKFRNVIRGTFNINGRPVFLRSKWEANYALYLDYLKVINKIKEWSYEQDVFRFGNIKRGTKTYKPDFKIITKENTTEYHEVKGWMTDRSRIQLKRMAKYYPKIILILIQRKEYMQILKQFEKEIKFIK